MSAFNSYLKTLDIWLKNKLNSEKINIWVDIVKYLGKQMRMEFSFGFLGRIGTDLTKWSRMLVYIELYCLIGNTAILHFTYVRIMTLRHLQLL